MTNQPKSLRTAAFLLAGVLATSCFVGGTMARYITTTSSEDSARVAVWGINADEVEMNLFNAEYDLNGNRVAKSWNGDKIIAPGTSMASKFSIVNLDDTLAPEVMYEIKIDVDDTEIDQRILDNPSIQWKLDDNAWGTWDNTKADLLALSGDASGVKTYQALEIAEEFANSKEHTIAWQWKLDDNHSQDTAMGNKAVDEDLIAKISVKVTARQVNIDSTGMLEGNGSVYNTNDPHPLTFKADADYTTFNIAKINGTEISDTNYTVESGSIKLTLNKNYLATLPIGSHILTIVTDNKEINAQFKVTDSTTIAHNDIIPEGGKYYVGVDFNYEDIDNLLYETIGNYDGYDALYEAGEKFPTPQVGDVYVYGDYEYRYKRQIMAENVWAGILKEEGWGVAVLNRTKTKYGNILTTINNKNIVSLQYTFCGMNNLAVAPNIPNTVTNMYSTFLATGITEMPIIPDSVVDMGTTFNNCPNLTKMTNIPKNVKNMNVIFAGSTNLTGILRIDANPTSYEAVFANTIKPIYLTGSSNLLNEISKESYTWDEYTYEKIPTNNITVQN